jgi:nucleoside-diphosphate-sugar epimerase
MRVIITGAGGFVGNGLARALCANPDVLGRPISQLILADLTEGAGNFGPAATWRCGGLADPAYLDLLLGEPVDCLFHLASLPGSLAERQPELGWAVNLSAPLALAARLARQAGACGPVPRVVFASSIAVYGPLGLDPVTEAAPTHPAISYGAHKLMIEILLADLTRRGVLDARSLRLPGIVARPVSESGHGSAFMSLLFHKALAAAPYTCPVSREATAWWMSLHTCIANLVHAARMEPAGLAPARSWQLPVLHASVSEVTAALEWRLQGDSTARFRFTPDETIERLFGRYPPLQTPLAHTTGFVADPDADALVENVLTGAAVQN